MTELGFLKTNDGNVIKVTEDMYEDFRVISGAYDIPVGKLISDFFDSEWVNNDEDF